GGFQLEPGDLYLRVYPPTDPTCSGAATVNTHLGPVSAGSYSGPDFAPPAAGTYYVSALFLPGAADIKNAAAQAACKPVTLGRSDGGGGGGRSGGGPSGGGGAGGPAVGVKKCRKGTKRVRGRCVKKKHKKHK